MHFMIRKQMVGLALLASAMALSEGCSSPDSPEVTPSPSPSPVVHASLQVSGSGAFGDVVASTQQTRTYTVTNTGPIDATLSAITAAGLGITQPFLLSGGTCVSGQSLKADSADSCTLIITYSPTDASQQSEMVSIGFRDATDLAQLTANFAISGTGALDCDHHPVPVCPKPQPALSISDGPTFDFGAIAVSLEATHTFKVTNSGNADAVLGSMSAADLGLSGVFALTGGTCTSGATVPSANGQCTLIVTYKPSAPVISSLRLGLSYSGSNLPAAIAQRTLTGEGALDCLNYPVDACPPALPELAFTDSVSSNFGKVNIGSTASSTFTLTNGGQVAGTLGTIDDASLGLSQSFTLSGGTCKTGTVLDANGGSCTLTIKFVPLIPGSPSQTLTVTYSGANGASSVTRKIYGTSNLDCSVAPLSGDYAQGVSVANSDNAAQTAQGTAAGLAASYSTGYRDGYAATYQASYVAAYQAAYKTSYNANYQSWYNASYSQTCPGATAAGKTDGISVGTADGNHDGYQDGYSDAYAPAYQDAYTQGYNSGHADTCGSGGPASAARIQANASNLAKARASSGASSGAPMRAADPTQDPNNQQACYNQGYSATYNSSAYQLAFNKAVKASPDYAKGVSDGTNQADVDAKSAGAPAGTADGLKGAQDDGTFDGAAIGYNTCYVAAYTSNYNSTYTTAYNNVYPSGSAAGDNDGTNTGYVDGYQDGVISCSGGAASPAARTLLRGTSPAGLAPTRASNPWYGLNQAWATLGPDNVVLDLFTQRPMLHGLDAVELNRTLRNQAREWAAANAAPDLRIRMLLRHRAGQANLP